MRGEDAGHDRHTQRYADLALRREDRRCSPILCRLDRRIARGLHRDESESHAHARGRTSGLGSTTTRCAIPMSCTGRWRVQLRRTAPLINRRGPMLAYTLPAITDDSMIPNACGNVVNPLASGVMPRRSCKYNGITNVTPRKLPIENSPTRLHCRNMRLCNRRRSSIGLGIRSSTTVVATAATTPITPQVTTSGDVHPECGPSLSV